MTFFSGTHESSEKANQKKRKLFFLTIFVHALILFAISYSHKNVSKNTAPKKMVVKTISPSTSAVKSSAFEKASIAPSSKVQRPSKTEAKKASKPITSKNITTKKNEKKMQSGAKAEPDYSTAKNLAKQLEDSLSKIEKGKIKSHVENTLSLPPPMALFQESPTPTSGINEKEAFFYHESLVKYLQHALHLPEYGNVKIALTLKPDGTVMKLEVITSESEKNKTFLEKNLPQIKFPGFSKSDGNEQKTFLLTFCNE